MNVSHCLSSLWPGFNSLPEWSIAKGFSPADHTLPTQRDKMAQSPLNGTTQLVDIKAEELRPTSDRQRLKIDLLTYINHSSYLEDV